MIRPLEPSPLDEEPLLRPLVLDADKEEGHVGGGGSSGIRQRPQQQQHHYSTRARSVVLQVHDQIIRVSDEEEAPDGAEGDDGRRLRLSSFAFGACGLRSFGHSPFWRFLGGLFKLIYAYYYFIWSIIYGGLALCFLVSIVYEGWSTGEPFGTAAIVVSMLPVLNLLWIFFAFVLHALFVGVFWDFYDLESALHAIRARLTSQAARTTLTALVAFLVNAPILFSLLVFCVAAAKPVSDRLWTTQFFLSFACNACLALLFFTGALIGVDHRPLPTDDDDDGDGARAASPSVSTSAYSRRRSLTARPGSWCRRCIPAAVRRGVRAFFQSDAFVAVRVYVKSSFQGGGVLTGGGGSGSAWGRYAGDAFLPAPVDLEGTTALEELYAQQAQAQEGGAGGGGAKGKGKGGGGSAGELRRLQAEVEGRGVKPWPTPWYLGWYIRRWFCSSNNSRGGGDGEHDDDTSSSSSSSCCCGGGGSGSGGPCACCLCGPATATQCCVALPWTLLLASLLLTLAIVAFSVKAYLLMGFVVVFFLLLPGLYHLLHRTVHSSFMGLLLVDLLLIAAFAAAFVLSLSLSSYYLGYPVLLIILAANLLTLLAHVPAIRDKALPPPQTHAQCLAFNAKRVTHRVITTARAWSWASIIILLVLVLMMKTVPANYATDKATASAALQRQRQDMLMRVRGFAAAGEEEARSPGGAPVLLGLGLGRNGSSSGLQQPPQPYAFCGQTFSRSRLSVLDLAHLSNAAYMELEEARAYVGEEVAGASRFNLSLLAMEEDYGPVTYLLDDLASRTLVFAIRGTNTVKDLFQDLDAYSEALVIQISTSLFPLYASPFFTTLLNKFVGTDYRLVEAITQLKDVLLNRQPPKTIGGSKAARSATTGAMATPDSRLYYKQLEAYIREHILPDPRYHNYQFLFTGHSLGGGVASIVGARLQALAVVFSSPGVVLSRRKFGLSLKEISLYVLNLVPQGDLVPLVDIQSVKSQAIVCSANRLSYHCHSILHTIDEIESTCQQGRAWREWRDQQQQPEQHPEDGGR